jgi:preprotein translocase subunit SecY
VIIIVGVVQDIVGKVKSDMLMQKYDTIDLTHVDKNIRGL